MNSSQVFGNLVQQEQRRILKFSFSIPEPPKYSKKYIQPTNILIETQEPKSSNELTNDQTRLVSFEESQTIQMVAQPKSDLKIEWKKEEEESHDDLDEHLGLVSDLESSDNGRMTRISANLDPLIEDKSLKINGNFKYFFSQDELDQGIE